MWCVATAVAQRQRECSATGVLRVASYPFTDFAATLRTIPAVACGRGFPSLSKEGALVQGFVAKLPVRWDSYCCQFFSMMVSS